jgi:hypothetical protein
MSGLQMPLFHKLLTGQSNRQIFRYVPLTAFTAHDFAILHILWHFVNYIIQVKYVILYSLASTVFVRENTCCCNLQP